MKHRFGIALLLLVSLTACGGGSGNSGLSAASPAAATAITAEPQNEAVTVGEAATFTVTATGTAPLSYQWEKNGAVISGATSASYTTPATTAGDSGETFLAIVSSSSGTVTSNSATLSVSAVPPSSGATTDISTYKYDVSRSGLNATETTLTLNNVNTSSFGLLRNLIVDGLVDAQPLYLAQLPVQGAKRNVVFAATEHNSVFAFDADTGATLWQVSLLMSGDSPSGNHGCGQITPEIGVTSTPVIDRSAGTNGTLYAVAMTIDTNGNYHQRLHALDAATGAELLNGPVEISATYPATGTATSTFDPGQHAERAGLLLSGGTLYTAWTSHCDTAPYSGWIIAFSQSTLAKTGILNVAANSENGPSIWMSGGAPAADSAGDVYLITANGDFDTNLDGNGFPKRKDFGNSFLKISLTGGSLAVADYFTQNNTVAQSNADRDLGSGGGLLLPDMMDASGATRHLMVGAGKDTNIYLVDRDSMGKFSSSANNIVQTVSAALPGGVWATPAFFNGTLYYGDRAGTLKAFALTAAKITATPKSQSATLFVYPGTAPSVSANGLADGIVWAHENIAPGVLHAYDASNLAHELYNSNQAANNKDQFGPGNKYITPVVADGKVFLGTTHSVAVFGLR